MINLIPNEEKKKKVKDFYFRLFVVFFMVLGFSTIVASVAIMPAYFLSSVKKNLAHDLLEDEKKGATPVPNQQIQATVEDLNTKLKLVDKVTQNNFLVSRDVVNEIILKKMPDIKIIEIVYENVSAEERSITIRGTARDRERLLLFRKALEDNPAFSKVDLPISNFIRGSDIIFSLSLTPA
jgi:hypothetical protein